MPSDVGWKRHPWPVHPGTRLVLFVCSVLGIACYCSYFLLSARRCSSAPGPGVHELHVLVWAVHATIIFFFSFLRGWVRSHGLFGHVRSASLGGCHIPRGAVCLGPDCITSEIERAFLALLLPTHYQWVSLQIYSARSLLPI